MKRTLGIFNNTRYDDPITLTWTLAVDGKKVAEDTKVHHVPAGGEEKFDVTVPMPASDHAPGRHPHADALAQAA